MKLTKLYIHNYKSFYDTTIELDKLNIVVGENNSGKSNLIDVLEFIDIAMSKDIERAIDDKGGYDKIKNYSAVGEEKVVVRATFEVYWDPHPRHSSMFGQLSYLSYIQGKGEITLSFSFSEKYYLFSINVNLTSKCFIDYDLKLDIDEVYEKFLLEDEKKINFIVSNKKYFTSNLEEKNRLFIFEKKDKDYINNCLFPILNYIGITILPNNLNMIQGFHYRISTYYFNAEKIKILSNKDSKYSELLKDGSNLGKILFEIKNKKSSTEIHFGIKDNKNKFEIISNSLITTVNEIDGIEVQEVSGNYIIGFKEREKEGIPIHTVSDGTINFLATMTALNPLNGASSLLVFEEPERHLHLNAVSYMLQAFRDISRQVIITTHSTEIIKYADLKEIVFIYRDSDGDTQSIRADAIPNLERKMKRLAYERDVTLDELIAEGMIGTFE